MIQWGLLDPNAYQRGYETGRKPFDELAATRKQNALEAAMRGYALNPDDPNTVNALAYVDPRLAIQARQQQAAAAQAKQAKDTALIATLARDAKDPASFDAAVDQVVQMGYPQAAQFKGRFSPELRSALMAAGGVKDDTPAQPNIAKEVDYYRSIGKPELAEQLLQRHAEGPPMVVENPDGTRTVYPRGTLGQPGPKGPASAPGGGPPPGTVEDGYRFKGGDPARSENWELIGGPTPRASGGFLP
jgi:hypothetical protein